MARLKSTGVCSTAQTNFLKRGWQLFKVAPSFKHLDKLKNTGVHSMAQVKQPPKQSLISPPVGDKIMLQGEDTVYM